MSTKITPGAIRFNTDSMKLEYYRGGPVGFGTTTTTGEWVNITTDTPDIQTGGTRGVFFSGYAPTSPTLINTINYVTISTTGNALDFGDMLGNRQDTTACSSRTRGVQGSSYDSVATANNTIEYITISSTGDAINFGDLTISANRRSSLSSSTRGIFAGGNPNVSPAVSSNVIEYITIASTGDAKDFGDLTGYGFSAASFASHTRGIVASISSSNTSLSGTIINFITISTLGNAADFGDTLTQPTYATNCCSNSTTGLMVTTGTNIEKLTISTLGNAVDFGDVTSVKSAGAGCASPTRGLFSGAGGPNDANNVIEYVTISSNGNSIDFGDLTHERTRHSGACSNGHGGLG